MKKLTVAFACVASLAGTAFAEDIKIGVLLGFTGPIESLVPPIAQAVELALQEASDSGLVLGGSEITAVRGDSTCIDSAAATAAAETLVTAEKVSAIVGANCSGVTGAVLQNVAKPNGIVMISPSATSPGLSSPDDDGLFFRTAPEDGRQGQLMAEIISERGYAEVAVTYTNNDYGKGLADSFAAAFEGMGGTVTIVAAHEDGRGDYSAEVGALDAAGGQALVVVGYIGQGGMGVIQASLDAGAFDVFVLPDGMIDENIIASFGSDLNGSFGQLPGSDSAGAQKFATMMEEAGYENSVFTAEGYDAAALIVLAMQAANSTMSADIKAKVFEVANAPGEIILPGELAKALEIIAAGGDVDYSGASDVELIGEGDAAGSYREVEVVDGILETVRYR